MRKFLLVVFELLLIQWAGAQLCRGSLGDPIVNITFGSGSNPGPRLSAATTNYKYWAKDCPDDGYYALANSTNNCFGVWHTLTSDHTGDPNGYLMMINASHQPGAFYIDTLDVLCNNTTYEVAAWILNMIGASACGGTPIQPNLTFNIEKTDGTVLTTYNTGPIPQQIPFNWKQYGFYFSTPVNVSKIVLRIFNNAPGGCGNDLAMDDITFRPCGPLLNASIDGGREKSICESDPAPQTLSCELSPGYTNPHFQWQQSIDSGATWTNIPGANQASVNLNLSSAAAGVYKYRLSVSKVENIGKPTCSINSNVISVRIKPKPAITIANNSPVCEGNTVTLSATGGVQYQWTDLNGFSSTSSSVDLVNAQPFQSGKYYVKVTDAEGCSDTASIAVQINPRPVASVQNSEIVICQGTSTSLQASGGNKYLWEPSDNLSSDTVSNPSASPTENTLYEVVVSNNFACTDTAQVQVIVSNQPVANTGPDTSLLAGQTISLTGSATGYNLSYSWSPSVSITDATTLFPRINPKEDVTYILEVVSNDGCGRDTDTVNVTVGKGFYVPNAFSPNGDGLNDTWRIPSLNLYSDYEVSVYNRYGQVIYRSKTTDRPWDGTFKGEKQPSGIYPYIIDVKDISQKFTGWVMLVR